MALPVRDGLPTRRFPWITLGLIAVNVFIFLFVQPSAFQNPPDLGESQGRSEYFEDLRRIDEAEEFVMRWGSVPCEIVTGEPVAEAPSKCDEVETYNVPEGKSVYLTLFTDMFLHGGVLHLAGNMLFLWVFGNNVEDRIGRLSYLVVYLLGGVAATLGYVAVNQNVSGPLIGASGAVAAVMGAYFVFHPRGRILTAIATAAFQVVYVPAAVVLGLFFVTQFFTADEYVAWEAHVAGMVAGFVMALGLNAVPAIRSRGRTGSAEAAGQRF